MHISTHTIQTLLATYGYLIVFLFVAVESLGVPFPGEIMLISAAAYAGTGHLNIGWVIAAAALGAILGFNGSYAIGRKGGRALIERYGPRIHLDMDRLRPAEAFFERHGDKTVFLARFVAILRAWGAFLAGLNGMPAGRFFVFNVAGGVVWAALYGFLAFEFGQTLLERVSKYVGIGAIVLVVVAALVLLFLRIRAERLERQVEGVAVEPPTDVRPD